MCHEYYFYYIGVWGLVTQRKQNLESVLDIWSGFVTKKESLESFITQCERSVDDTYKGFENPASTVAINGEIMKLKVTTTFE